MPSLEQRVKNIELRNNRVEMDKAWETSWVRRLSIAAFTYATVAGYLALVIESDRPLVHAATPALGYLMSTLVLSRIRKRWES